MLRNATLLALALAIHPAAQAAERNDDAAWLQRVMNAPMAPGVPVPAERVQRVDFPALARLAGQRARVDTLDGGSARGLVERADADTVVLRILRSTGLDSVTFARADVRAVWVD